MEKKKGKVTGLGGVFFKSEDPDSLKKWYTNNLGLDTDQYGHMFKWLYSEDPDKVGYTQWSVFDAKTDYLNPSKKDYMINFRVENIEALIEELKSNGMKVIGDMESYDYGKFAWVMDPDGNKVELWEPVDEVFTKTESEKDKP
jgi:predicted enzyme related to lactoylglutathione lyase